MNYVPGNAFSSFGDAVKSFVFDERLHSLIYYNSFRKFINLLLLETEKLLRRKHVNAYPIRLAIEPTNVCNLKCPECHTGRGDKGRDKGYRSVESFTAIINDIGRYAYLADIYLNGESLLHKDITDMIRIAERHGVCTYIHSNFNINFTKESAEKLVKSKLSYLSLSIDGADNGVYEVYRCGGNFDKVIKNASLVLDAKKRLQQVKPYLIWQYLVFPHNQGQVEDARRLARSLGFDGFRALKGIIRTEVANYSKGDMADTIPRRKDLVKPSCDWLWTNATFHWDDGVAPCCLQFSEDDDFGFYEGKNFREIWNNEKFTKARSLFALCKDRGSDIPERVHIICSRCFKSGL